MAARNTTSTSSHPARLPVMYDVVRLAGVSHQTVSRVINDLPNVRATTRDRVLDAMRQLDYRPNIVARSLATSRTNRIGVIGFDVRYFGPGSTLVAIERAAVVAVDQRRGAEMETQQLLGLGHRTVWHIAGPTDWREAQ